MRQATLSRCETMKIAVMGDIHSAAKPFRQALQAARTAGCDQIIILGDLLTYGPEPREVLDLAADACAKDGAILLCGNHDQLYIDLQQNEAASMVSLPDWIRESAEWTLARIEDLDMKSSLPWRDEWIEGEVLFSHANPFGRGNWTYLREPADFRTALSVLAERGLRHGIFGHTHRCRRHELDGRSAATIGAIGQPRDENSRRGAWTSLTMQEDQISLDEREICRDWSWYVEAILKTNLSDETKSRICGFFHD